MRVTACAPTGEHAVTRTRVCKRRAHLGDHGKLPLPARRALGQGAPQPARGRWRVARAGVIVPQRLRGHECPSTGRARAAAQPESEGRRGQAACRPPSGPDGGKRGAREQQARQCASAEAVEPASTRPHRRSSPSRSRVRRPERFRPAPDSHPFAPATPPAAARGLSRCSQREGRPEVL